MKSAIAKDNVLAYAKPKKIGIFRNIKKEPGLQQQIEKHQGSKIIGKFCMLIHSYISYRDI